MRRATRSSPHPTLVAGACAALLSACGGGSTSVVVGGGDYAVNTRPAFVAGTPATTQYDGTADDLLTAGLGRAGLAGAAPTLSTPATAAELRKLAIYTNYRAIVDINAAGGYGTLYGPNIAADGTVGSGDGKIAGSETIAYADDGSGRQNVTMMVQIPSTFDPRSPCIVTATAAGSRGGYGAIGSAGEWGLKRGCAVAYTDKGTGLGVHDLQANTVNAIDGRRVDAAAAGRGSSFTAALTDAERTAFNTATPNRFAVKHAHSEQNPEKDWGLHTLQAVEFAFWVLNERFGEVRDGQRTKSIVPANTIVIASSVSNGGGAALAAAEQDSGGWIDGVAVSEPNVQLAPRTDLRIERPSLPAYTAGPRPLYDYFTYANLLQPCAALAAGAVGSPFAFSPALQAGATNRCAALAAAGLVSGATLQERADDALARLRAYGWEPETNLLQASHWQFATTSIAATYANTYGRFRVSDNVCGFSFAALDGTGAPTAANPALLNGVFGTGNGIPPMGATMGLVWNNAVGGARNHAASLSPSSGLYDFAGDGANCLRALWTGSDANANRVKAGAAETYRSANLRGKPAIIVHGRSDTLIPVNFSSRPYVLRNAQVEGAASRLRYIEVTNAQHFDSFLGFPGYSNSYIPLHVYFNRAMDAMWAHLKTGASLPPNQLVRTTPRGGTLAAPNPIAASNVPVIAATPAAGDRIEITGTTMRLPD
jgi:hydroxybutyrate-dimer hydrolase